MPLFPRPRPADIFDGTVDYLAQTPEGPVGIVDGWKRDAQNRPSAIIIAQGWFGRRRFEIPIDKLIEIDHEERRVVLAPAAAPLEPAGLFHETTTKRPQGLDQPGPVLCGVAEDSHAAMVVAVAAQLARALGAPLVFAHATLADLPPGVSAAADGQARLLEEERGHANEFIDTLLLSALTRGTDVKRIIARGTPAETLERLAHTEGAQLLVIGTTGKGSLGTLLRGSVSKHLTSHAPCPVVLIPPKLSTCTDDDEADETLRDLPHEAGLGMSRTDW